MYLLFFHWAIQLSHFSFHYILFLSAITLKIKKAVGPLTFFVGSRNQTRDLSLLIIAEHRAKY